MPEPLLPTLSSVSTSIDKSAFILSFVSSQKQHLRSYASTGRREASKWLGLDSQGNDERLMEVKGEESKVSNRVHRTSYSSPVLHPRIVSVRAQANRVAPSVRNQRQSVEEDETESSTRNVTGASTMTTDVFEITSGCVHKHCKKECKKETKGLTTTRRPKREPEKAKERRQDTGSDTEREERLAQRRERRRTKKEIVAPLPLEPRKHSKQTKKASSNKKIQNSGLSALSLLHLSKRANNVGEGRLTTIPKPGLFNKGKASSKTTVKATGYKPFSELEFLNGPITTTPFRDSCSSRNDRKRKKRMSTRSVASTPETEPPEAKKFKITNYSPRTRKRPQAKSIITISSDSTGSPDNGVACADSQARSETWDIELDLSSEAKENEGSVQTSTGIKTVVVNYRPQGHEQIEETNVVDAKEMDQHITKENSGPESVYPPPVLDSVQGGDERMFYALDPRDTFSVEPPTTSGSSKVPDDNVSNCCLGATDISQVSSSRFRDRVSGHSGSIAALERAICALESENNSCDKALFGLLATGTQNHSSLHYSPRVKDALDPELDGNAGVALVRHVYNDVPRTQVEDTLPKLEHYTQPVCMDYVESPDEYAPEGREYDNGALLDLGESELWVSDDDIALLGDEENGSCAQSFIFEDGCLTYEHESADTDGHNWSQSSELQSEYNCTADSHIVHAPPVDCDRRTSCCIPTDAISDWDGFSSDDYPGDSERGCRMEKFLVGKALRLGLDVPVAGSVGGKPIAHNRNPLRELELDVGRTIRDHWHPVKY